MKNELVIVWQTGETEVHQYNTAEEAENAKAGFEMVFGNQVWCCVR